MSHLKILVVEDEFMVASLLQKVLERAGYEVIGPSDTCSDALGHLGRVHIDGATLDLSLVDRESSAPVAVELEAQSIPYIVVSGYDGVEAVTDLGLRPHSVVSKPFSITDLLEAIKQCLQSVVAQHATKAGNV